MFNRLLLRCIPSTFGILSALLNDGVVRHVLTSLWLRIGMEPDPYEQSRLTQLFMQKCRCYEGVI